jgi:hypothetical protein
MTGTRTWTSLEGELTIGAQHDGHIRLQIRLHDSYPNVWSATANLIIDPGEQFASIASDIRELADGS